MKGIRGRVSGQRARGAWWGRLIRDRRGQVVVEFMLSLIITLLVVLAIIEVCTLCTDLFLTRYASFVAARGYLARADWKRGGYEAATQLVINNTGRVKVEEVEGRGVRLSVEVREFFPIHTLFKDTDRTWLMRETFLGRAPRFSGDNQPDYSGGGIWEW